MANKIKQKSLYVHIPFCVKKCLFCSFAVSIGQSHKVDQYLEALAIEAKRHKGEFISSVYLGGGTPSFLNQSQLGRLTGIIRDNFTVSSDGEWTIEANPEGIDAGQARNLKVLGFTRVSLGVQSFNDAYLKFLGRVHDRSAALRAIDIIRAAGFDNVNIDLMYGFPKQTREELESDLEMVVGLKSKHVSIYTLTIEPNSRFYAKQMKLDDDDKLADDYVFVADFLERSGLQQYEVSNFARPGFESKHNIGYWTGVNYIGLGMGAHSFCGSERSWNTENLMEYLDRIKALGRATEGQEELSLRTQFMERLIFGLRMNEGVAIPLIENETGFDLPMDAGSLIDGFVLDGFLIKEGENLRTSLKGRLVLDQLAARLI